MNLEQYQEWVIDRWDSGGGQNLTSRDDYIMGLGLGGECGEVLEVLKKKERDKNKPESPYTGENYKTFLLEELGDLLYYLTMVASRHDIPLQDIIDENVRKLNARKKKM